ncbi:hypothetical protein ES705_31477 [subsurface metagenome]
MKKNELIILKPSKQSLLKERYNKIFFDRLEEN